MKAAIPYFLGAIAGAAITDLVLYSEGSQQAATEDPRPVSRHKTDSGSRSGTAHQRATSIQSLEDRMEKISKLYGKKRALELQKIDPKDAKSLILHTLGKTDLMEGLNYKDEQVVTQLLQLLASSDLDSATRWIDQNFQGETRNTAYKKLIEKHFADASSTATLEFAMRHLEPDTVSDVAGRLLLSSSKGLDTSSAIELLDHVKMGNSGGGSTMNFSKDFDFAQFVDRAVELKTASKQSYFSSFPTNLLEEWAKRDPNKAIAYYNEHLMGKDMLPFNSFSELVSGYVSTANAQESQQWLAETLKPGAMPERERKNLIEAMLRDQDLPDKLLENVVPLMNLSGEETLVFYNTLSSWGGDSVQPARLKALRLFSDPASRMQALENHFSVKSNSRHNKEQLEQLYLQLEKLGHTEQEITRLRQLSAQGK